MIELVLTFHNMGLHVCIVVAQRLNRLLGMRENWVRSLGREDPLEKEMAILEKEMAIH